MLSRFWHIFFPYDIYSIQESKFEPSPLNVYCVSVTNRASSATVAKPATRARCAGCSTWSQVCLSRAPVSLSTRSSRPRPTIGTRTARGMPVWRSVLSSFCHQGKKPMHQVGSWVGVRYTLYFWFDHRLWNYMILSDSFLLMNQMVYSPMANRENILIDLFCMFSLNLLKDEIMINTWYSNDLFAIKWFCSALEWKVDMHQIFIHPLLLMII